MFVNFLSVLCLITDQLLQNFEKRDVWINFMSNTKRILFSLLGLIVRMDRFIHRILFILILLSGSSFLKGQSASFRSYAQQDPQFTQYMFNPVYFNVAAVGNEQAWVSTVNIRNQWVNLPGAPVSQSLTSHLPIYKLHGGAGITIVNDIAGQQRNTGAMFMYAYQKQFRTSTLSFGAGAGFIQQSIDGSKLITPTGNYENNVNHNDPNLPVTLSSELLPDASAGIYFFGKNLTAGIAASHLLSPILNGKDATINDVQYYPGGNVYISYKFEVNDKIDITPNVLYKTDFVESIVDVNTIFTYNRNILAGVSFRGYANSQYDAVALIAGLNITDKWRVSYSYDITTSALNTVSSGSHELVLRYSIPVAKPRVGKMINNPRYLYH